MKSNEILVIDDEQVILEAIKRVCEFHKLSAETCLTVSDAENLLKQNQYKLIICDIMMPDKDGFELLKYVRNNKINTPVIITTGYTTLENAVKTLYDGAVGFIPKPFSVDELTSMIVRGLRYGNILKSSYNICASNEDELLGFIPCPPKYYRLGFDSWINEQEEGLVHIGVSDLFLKSIGNIKNIEFMHSEEIIFQGGNCLKIYDDEDCTHQLLSPISGRIIDINEKIITNQILLEKDPYFSGWIYKAIPINLNVELENLISCSSDV